MGLISRRVSDISGKEGAEDAFAQVVVRVHPRVEQAKKLDALPDELKALKNIADLVVLEVRFPGDDTVHELHVRYEDFASVVPDDVVKNAPGTRGRPQGFRPTNG